MKNKQKTHNIFDDRGLTANNLSKEKLLILDIKYADQVEKLKGKLLYEVEIRLEQCIQLKQKLFFLRTKKQKAILDNEGEKALQFYYQIQSINKLYKL